MDEIQKNATITVRIIKSFPYKNFRALVFHSVDLTSTRLEDLRQIVKTRIEDTPNLAQYRACDQWDTFKTYYHAHGAKTNNPMINVSQDESLLLRDEEATLFEMGIRHESEVSLFNYAEYRAYCENPILKWE